MYKLRTILFIFCIFLSSCKEPVRTYRVAVEQEEATSTTSAKASPQESTQGSGVTSVEVTWTAPSSWKQEEVGQFLTAAYTIPNFGRLTVSKLGGDGGGLAANVNRWRGQVNMPTLPDDVIKGQQMPIAGSEHSILLFNLNPDEAADTADGIFAGVLQLASETWYFKLTAPAAKLRAGGPELFTEFLSSVRVGGGVVKSPAPPSAATFPKINVTKPDGWEASKGSTMRVASFSVSGANGETADVSVIPLPGDSGTVLDNVNRWRGQIQLPALTSDDDPAIGTEMEGASGKVFVTHMVSEKAIVDGKKSAISTAILKAKGITWFFKITGDASLVEAQREAFVNMARTATFP